MSLASTGHLRSRLRGRRLAQAVFFMETPCDAAWGRSEGAEKLAQGGVGGAVLTMALGVFARITAEYGADAPYIE